MKLGIAFVVFWTAVFAVIERLFFHMTLEQIMVARSVAGIFNFVIGCKYHYIKRIFGAAKGMVFIKLAVTGLAYTTVIFFGLTEFHFWKLMLKTFIATGAGLIVGKLGLFDIFFLGFDKVWVGVFGGRREMRSQVVRQGEKVEQD